MSTNIFVVPAGITQQFSAPALSSVCVQPNSGGTALLQYATDGIAPPFISAPQGASATPYSFNTSTWSGLTPGLTASPMGNIGKIQVTATTGSANVLISDLQQYPLSFPERLTAMESSVAYTMPNTTTEQTLASIRFHAGYFRANWRVFVYLGFTVTNNANVKTAKVYFGNSNNGNAANFIETTAAAGQTQAMTSFSGFTMQAKVGGRNDGQTAVWQSLGSAGGLGGNTTANVLLTLLNYFPPSVAVEQVLTITGTKATGADVLTLDSILVEVRQ